MTSLASRAGPLLVAGLMIALAGCDDDDGASDAATGGGEGGGRPPASVAVVEAAPEAIPIVNELPGRVAATRSAEVRPRVSGLVTERVFKQGSTVAEGDVLYRIDPAQFRSQVERAEAALARAKAQRKAAEQTAERQEKLRDRNVVSAQKYDDAAAALAEATAGVSVAQAELTSAQIDLEHAEVKAPIRGRIGRARITEGALVSSADSQSMATIKQLDPVYADFTQSASALLDLRRAFEAGKLEDTEGGAAAVHLLLDDGTEYGPTGKLLFSEAEVEETTGQVTLRAEFPNPDGDLLPGMYVRVRIQQGVEPKAFAVPKQAVQYDLGGTPQLYLVDAEDKIEVRTVTAGRTLDARRVITDGLSGGERVVVEGFQKIQPGAKVAPEPWKKTDEKAVETADADGDSAG